MAQTARYLTNGLGLDNGTAFDHHELLILWQEPYHLLPDTTDRPVSNQTSFTDKIWFV